MYSEERPLPYEGGDARDLQESPLRDYASWGSRVLAAVIDSLLLVPFEILRGLVEAHKASSDPYAGTADGAAVAAMLLTVAMLGVAVWNVFVKQGRTGQTIGKELLKIKLVRESTGEPIGSGSAFLRQIAHILDGISFYIGYLWPLWDRKRQTFADKLMKTIVINAE